jgi:hypothetical protein
MQVDLEKIPTKYILRRYTRNARQELPFDRTDKKLVGKDGETKAYRTKMLLLKSMAVVRHGSMSKVGFERAIEVLTQLVELLSTIEPNIGGDGSCVTSDVEVTQTSIYVLVVLFV